MGRGFIWGHQIFWAGAVGSKNKNRKKVKLTDSSTDGWMNKQTDKTGHKVLYVGHIRTKKIYVGTFDLYEGQKQVQLLILIKKMHGFTCILANPKPLFFP